MIELMHSVSHLLQSGRNQLLDHAQRFSLTMRRRTGTFDEMDTPNENNNIPLDRNNREIPTLDVSTLRNINQILWKTEVDLENIEDMMNRYEGSQSKFFPPLSKNLDKFLRLFS